jgi:hypothetical protein
VKTAYGVVARVRNQDHSALIVDLPGKMVSNHEMVQENSPGPQAWEWL